MQAYWPDLSAVSTCKLVPYSPILDIYYNLWFPDKGNWRFKQTMMTHLLPAILQKLECS